MLLSYASVQLQSPVLVRVKYTPPREIVLELISPVRHSSLALARVQAGVSLLRGFDLAQEENAAENSGENAPAVAVFVWACCYASEETAPADDVHV